MGFRRCEAMSQIFGEFFAEERGATAIEYSLVAGLISLVCVGAMTAVGTLLFELFQRIATIFANLPL